MVDQTVFSVVIPLYNKRAFIAATLQSALDQTLPPAEIIVVDDGSQDGGDALVEEIAARNGAVPILLLRRDNGGPGPARNQGIAQARGGLIAFLDADDVWRGDHLACLAAAERNFPQAVLFATAYRRMDGIGRLPPDPVQTGIVLHDFYAQGTDVKFCTSCVAIRRETLLSHGGFAPFRRGEDTDLWIRLALNGPFALSDAATVGYVRDDAGLMASAPTELSPVFGTMAALLANRRYAPRHAALAAYDQRLRQRFARQHLYRGEPLAARALLTPWTGLWLATFTPPALLLLAARLWRWARSS